MPKETVEALVSGGKATPAPPLGPSLSPLGINVVQVVKEINDKTALFAGMEVPVKIVVDTETKKFTVSVGTPPVTSMIKKEMKKEKLATVGEDKIRKSPGSITLEAVIKIAKSKDSIRGNLASKVKQVLGTCQSGGVLVDEKSPKDVIKEISDGTIKIE
ncbi:MAG: 50S ribosomal protein L11, large subunit ribosomal protein L11 [archaeon GW2011_AR5]|nr:MAG: 50S ribosomal protein L11, large subunit ribosomal protein L11 [archaeon GW2011_AR5]